MIKVKKLHPDALIPMRVKGSAGLDLFSIGDWEIGLVGVVCVSTGIAMEIPAGHVGLICDRSSLGAKGLTTRVAKFAPGELACWLEDCVAEEDVSYTAGVIDSSYRGEIRVVLKNMGNEPYQIKKGDRIAQLVIVPVNEDGVCLENESVVGLSDNLSETERGTGGFGSTGK